MKKLLVLILVINITVAQDAQSTDEINTIFLNVNSALKKKEKKVNTNSNPYANFKISGTVTDKKGIPLPGASIVFIDKNQGATTDFDGNFSISAKKGDVIEFSYVRKEPLKVTVGVKNKLTVTLNRRYSFFNWLED